MTLNKRTMYSSLDWIHILPSVGKLTYTVSLFAGDPICDRSRIQNLLHNRGAERDYSATTWAVTVISHTHFYPLPLSLFFNSTLRFHAPEMHLHFHPLEKHFFIFRRGFLYLLHTLAPSSLFHFAFRPP